MRGPRLLTGLVLLFALGGGSPALGQTQSGAWLDAPLSNWNRPDMDLPTAAPQPATNPRCAELNRPPETPADHQLAERGWLLFSAYQGGWGVDVVHAGSGQDGMCRPMQYNVFVFRHGEFVGIVSPELMDSRTTGQEAGTTLTGPQEPTGETRLTARFLRYAPNDPLCCPSLPAVAVIYAIQATPSGFVLAPVEKEPG